MMKPSEDVELLKDKIKELEHALDKQRHKKSLKTIFSGKATGKTDRTISVSLLSKLINSSVDGIIAADKAGNLLVFNDAAAAIFGYTVAEALADFNIRDLYPENGAHEVMAKLRSDGYGGAGKLAGHLVHVRNKNGDSIPVRMNASVVYEDDREIATIGYLRDLLDKPVDALSNTIPSLEAPDQDVSLQAYLSSVTRQMQLYDQQFCVGAIKNELATVAQVKQALRKQSEITEKTKVHVPIGRIMIQLGILSETQRDAIINLFSMEIQQQASDRKTQEDMTAASPPADSAGDDEPTMEDIVSLAISGDRLEATIHIEKTEHEIALEDILNLIKDKGIVFGIVDETELGDYLVSPDNPSGPFIIARGQAPAPEKPPEVHHFFSTDPLGIGTTREDGTTDWKNRGKLPQAKPGDVLAEITPGIPGVSGRDIFGDEIGPPAAKSSLAKCGKGVTLSEDGTQYLAKLNGMVSLSDNKMSLIEAMVVNGDVGLETGHIDFDGHVEVGGSIHKGYRVSCKSLRAEDIHEAEITVAGDMIAMGGIYESDIKCKGSLQVSQIRKSRVHVGGDLIAQKEIMESTIESSGKFLIEEGTIIFSEISAKDGIVAGDIGTKGSKPSTLIVGVDQRTKRQIKYTKNKLEQQKKELTLLPEEVENLEEKIQTVEIEKTELSKTLSCHIERIESMQKQAEMLETRGRDSDALKMQKIIDNLNSEQERMEAHIQETESDMEKMSERAFQKHEDILNGQKDLDLLVEELDALVAAKASHQEGSVAQVNGSVFSGTIVTGPNASLTISDDFSRLIIKEVKRTGEDGTESTAMQMQGMD